VRSIISFRWEIERFECWLTADFSPFLIADVNVTAFQSFRLRNAEAGRAELSSARWRREWRGKVHLGGINEQEVPAGYR
jgi:hypothetical protein